MGFLSWIYEKIADASFFTSCCDEYTPLCRKNYSLNTPDLFKNLMVHWYGWILLPQGYEVSSGRQVTFVLSLLLTLIFTLSTLIKWRMAELTV